MDELLKIENLSVGIKSPAGKVQAVRDVSFTLHPGEVLAIVGESGCGKSMLCKTIMKLLPKSAKIEGGKIIANGVDITDYSDKDMRKLRGKLFSMIFQDPMTAHILIGVVCNVHTVCNDLSTLDFGRFGQQLHNGLAEHTFSAAALAYNGKHLAGVQCEAHIPDSLHFACRRFDSNRQIFYFQ